MIERFAILEIAPEILGEVVGLVVDHGLEIVASLDSEREGFNPAIVLVIKGAALPDECAGMAGQVVRMTVTVEAYGSQRLRRISEITVDKAATDARVRRLAANR